MVSFQSGVKEREATYRSQLLHVLGPSSTEHERLTVRANLRNDLADLRLETHVQHAISLVHDKIGDTAQVGLAGFKHVDETTWGCNYNFHPAL